MLELVWESRDRATAIYRRGQDYWLIHAGHYAFPSTTYLFACSYVADEFCDMKLEEPFPALA